MGLSTKNRIMFNRRRFNFRKTIIRNGIILAVVISVVFVISSIVTANALKEKVANSTVAFKKEENKEVIEENTVPVISDEVNNENVEQENKNIDNKENELNIEVNETEEQTKGMTINLLGEIMMGGTINSNINYMYSNAIKEVYSTTRLTDFTYANFSTNITNLEKIEDPRSKYLVTKNVTSALEALGLDAVSIASDHIIDFPEDIVNNTKTLLEQANIFVAGKENLPVYFEKNGKKIAIVSTNSVIIGTADKYTKQGISVYSKDNLKKNIKEAKEAADIVIADIHWGRDQIYGVTEGMREMARFAIDNGADMVIGSHALGVYPIVKYNDKPIIYSTGYLMSDLDYNVAKDGFIFKVNISEEMKITSLEMTPIYIEQKQRVLLYNEYDKALSDEYLEQFNRWHLENGLKSTINNNKIIIEF